MQKSLINTASCFACHALHHAAMLTEKAGQIQEEGQYSLQALCKQRKFKMVSSPG